MRRTHKMRLVAGLAAVGLATAACGEPPGEGNGGSGSSDTDFVGCMVTDEGGPDDKSFNETSWKGLQDAAAEGISAKPRLAESNAASDYEPNVDQMVKADCGLIVTVGFLLADATKAAAEANPEEKFAIVDYLYTDKSGKPTPIDNVKPLVFNTHEAAFLAGYLAAAQTKTNKVATWGGAKIPTVTIFMDGFYDGVQHYNKTKNKNVQVLGWNKKTQDGQFVGNFNNSNKAKQISENLLNDGADIMMPVAGPIGEAAAVAAKEQGDVSIIWVDSDGYEALPKYKDIILTSVIKGMDVAVKNAAAETAEGNFSNEPFVGTLENKGVSLAPYHDFDSKVSDETKKEIDDLTQQIIAGDLKVESDAAF
ncbi:BMP family lipoprotein [Thermocrispum municipale]|uniref:BMP family lipoprotein n=1 Tax=Thermocrispum municipale TaxID=37926 RepID=UPI00041DEA65|nr:BMP family ABC transporter substrate-binding protein [Thermocrispum municipale]